MRRKERPSAGHVTASPSRERRDKQTGHAQTLRSIDQSTPSAAARWRVSVSWTNGKKTIWLSHSASLRRSGRMLHHAIVVLSMLRSR